MSKILLCDDDKGVSEVIQIMLENNGFEVKLLESGKAIQKRVKEYSPNLILIDIWMPGIGGKEAIKLLKKDKATKNIPIIIISALDETEVAGIVKTLGVEGYLLKPFNMEDLLAVASKFAV